MRSSLVLVVVILVLVVSAGTLSALQRNLHGVYQTRTGEVSTPLRPASVGKSTERWPGMRYEISPGNPGIPHQPRTGPQASSVEGVPPPCTSGFVAIDLFDLSTDNPRWDNDIRVSIAGLPSSNPQMASREDGTLYLVHEKEEEYELVIYLSIDQGQTWIPWTLLADTYFFSRPTIAVGEGVEDRLMVAYEAGQLDDYHIHMFWRDLNSTDQGIVCIDVGGRYPLWDPRLAVSSPVSADWHAYITYRTYDVDTEQNLLTFARSENFGLNWIDHQRLDSGDVMSWPDVEFGGNGALWLAYSVDPGNAYVRRSWDSGHTWEPTVAVPGNMEDEQRNPNIACSKFGDEVIVAYDALYNTNYDIDMVYSRNGVDWEWSYLPWTGLDERGVDIIWSGQAGVSEWFHAVFSKRHQAPNSDVIYSAAPMRDLSPSGWKAATVVNSGGTAVHYAPTMTTNRQLTPEAQAAIAWHDARNGISEIWFDAFYMPDPAAVDGGLDRVERTRLTVHPQPASWNARIVYDLPRSSRARIAVMDVSGRLVRLLTNTEEHTGRHEVLWDLRNQVGRPVPSGMYYVALRSNIGDVRGKILVLR